MTRHSAMSGYGRIRARSSSAESVKSSRSKSGGFAATKIVAVAGRLGPSLLAHVAHAIGVAAGERFQQSHVLNRPRPSGISDTVAIRASWTPYSPPW